MRSFAILAALAVTNFVHCLPTGALDLISRKPAAFSTCHESSVAELGHHESRDDLKIRTCSVQGIQPLNNRDVKASAECVTGKDSTVSFQYFTSAEEAPSTTEDPALVLGSIERSRPKYTDCTTNYQVSASMMNIAIGVYSGKNISASAVTPIYAKLKAQLSSGDLMQDTVMQLCGGDRKDIANIFGVVINLNGDIAGVEQKANDWSQGKCVNATETEASKLDVSIVENFQKTKSASKQGKSGRTWRASNHH